MPSSAISDFPSESYFNPNKKKHIYSAYMRTDQEYENVYTNRDFTNFLFKKKKLTLSLQ